MEEKIKAIIEEMDDGDKIALWNESCCERTRRKVCFAIIRNGRRPNRRKRSLFTALARI